jgi:hypothetical protein
MRRTLADLARGLTAAGVLLSAAVHLQLWDVGGYSQLPTIGPLFLLNAVAGLTLGVVLVTWRHWLPSLAGAGFGAATLVAFWISVLHGLFGLRDSATGSAQVLAEVAEIVALCGGLGAVALLGVPRLRRSAAAGGPAVVDVAGAERTGGGPAVVDVAGAERTGGDPAPDDPGTMRLPDVANTGGSG